MICNMDLIGWIKGSIFFYPIFLSFVAAIIFWLIFAYIPERIRRSKLRPIVERSLLECYQQVFSLFNIVMSHNRTGPSYFQEIIRSGKLTEEMIRLGLQNKCLNESYLFDPKINDKLIVVGEDIYKILKNLEQLTNKVIGYSYYASARELLLLENIVTELRRYDRNMEDISKPALRGVGNMSYLPTIPSIYYRHENFSKTHELFCSLQEIVFNELEISTRDYLISKIQYLFYSGQYKKLSFLSKCFIKNAKSNDIVSVKSYYALSLWNQEKYSKFYKIIEEIYSSKPYSGSLVSSRSFLAPVIKEKKVLEIIGKFYSEEDIRSVISCLKSEDENKEVFIKSNVDLSVYFSLKDTRLKPIDVNII